MNKFEGIIAQIQPTETANSNGQAAADAGAIEAVMKAMTEHVANEFVQKRGCESLGSVCEGSDAAAKDTERNSDYKNRNIAVTLDNRDPMPEV